MLSMPLDHKRVLLAVISFNLVSFGCSLSLFPPSVLAPSICMRSSCLRMVTSRRSRRGRRLNSATTDLSMIHGQSIDAPVPVTPSPKKKKRRASKPSSPKTTTIQADSHTQPRSLTTHLVAKINPSQQYIDLKVPPTELRPSATLTTGQCFHWRALERPNTIHEATTPSKKSAWGSHNATEWVGTLRLKDGVSVVVAIQETATTTLYRPLTTQVSADDLFLALKEYFRLQHSLAKISQTWSSSDSRLATIADCIPGVRIVEQDPFECLISFICSSNNNIPRITKMVNAIRANYGDELLSIGEETFYSFPSLEQFISKANDDDLKSKCGLGYRSKYILETLPLLQEKGGEAYLADLREINDPIIVQDKLIEFCGVGRKVADCVALFSLRQDDAIPVDVHVWNIARRDYDPDNALATVKSLTPTTYRQVGDLFRSRFTQKAGWAHSLLFVAELPSFRPVLPKGLVEEMDFFKENEKLKKKEAVAAKKKRKQDECREKLVL